jgi:hypothetical protein
MTAVLSEEVEVDEDVTGQLIAVIALGQGVHRFRAHLAKTRACLGTADACLFLRAGGWRGDVRRDRKGKTLVIVNQAMSAPETQGMVTVFFELNGQPRRIKVPDRSAGASGTAVRRKAELGSALQPGAPMPASSPVSSSPAARRSRPATCWFQSRR